jgi:tRNA-modifying protein YgfZ
MIMWESAVLESEYQAVVAGAGWRESEPGLLRVTGRDCTQWLHKLITADVEHLAVGQGVRAALLEAKGHFVAEFVALMLQDAILLLVDGETKEALLNNLRHYVFREKVQVGDETGAWRLVTLIGGGSDELTARLLGRRAPDTPYYFALGESNGVQALLVRSVRAPVPAADVLIPAQAWDDLRAVLDSIPALSAATCEVLRIEAGQPRWGVDFDSSTLALEIPKVLSVRVDQGCYVGQEVVARIVHRGHVNRQLVGLKMDGERLPARGDPILSDGSPVGSVTSAAQSPHLGAIALGYVRREVSEPGTTLQVGSDLQAHVVDLPFAVWRPV